jgi:hypothetical protein
MVLRIIIQLLFVEILQFPRMIGIPILFPAIGSLVIVVVPFVCGLSILPLSGAVPSLPTIRRSAIIERIVAEG